MKNEGAILDHLRAAIACVFGGLPDQARTHVEAARRELARSPVERGLAELRDAKPIARVIEWDTTDVDAESGGEG